MSLHIKRWLRALDIAKILFEEEGYHTLYLEQIENLIRTQKMPPKKAVPKATLIAHKGGVVVTREQLMYRRNDLWEQLQALEKEIDAQQVSTRHP